MENLFIYCLVGLLGLTLGSLINVCIYRIPFIIQADEQDYPAQTTINLFSPASFCPHCRHPLKAKHKIPLLSYFLLKRKCKFCKTPIHTLYPIIEALSALFALFCVVHYGLSLKAGFAWLLFAYLITLSIIDIKTRYLPDLLTLSLLWLGLIANLSDLFSSPPLAILGAIFGYLALWSVYWLFKLTCKIEGMGYGDFKLCAALGAWFGLTNLPKIIFIASIMGFIFGTIFLKMKGKSLHHSFAFGPYLAISGLIILLFPNFLSQFFSITY